MTLRERTVWALSIITNIICKEIFDEGILTLAQISGSMLLVSILRRLAGILKCRLGQNPGWMHGPAFTECKKPDKQGSCCMIPFIYTFLRWKCKLITSDRKQSACLGTGCRGECEEGITERHEDTFGGGTYSHYLDFGNGFTGVEIGENS